MDDLREDFESAFDEVEKQETEEPTAEVEEPEAEPEAPEADPAPEEPQGEEPPANEEPPNEEEPQEPPPEAASNSKAPASWTAKARESWGKVPEEARAQIEKREKEVLNVLQESATARQFAKRLNDTLAPYQQGLMAAGYQDPLQAVNSFLATEATLRGGTAHDKAYTVANLIKTYGVDVGTLDNLLAGQVPAQGSPQNSQIEDLLNQRLAPVENLLQQQQYQAQQQQLMERQNANQQVETFKQNHEFLDDVRQDMANLMDGAAARGEAMDLERAYTIACQIHPEISQIMAQRAKEQQIMGTRQEVAKKKAAAVSVTGTPAGEPSADRSKMTLRDEIADAWNSQTG